MMVWEEHINGNCMSLCPCHIAHKATCTFPSRQDKKKKKKMLLTAFTIDQQLYLRRPVSFYPEFWATALLKKNILIIKKF